MTVTIRRIDWRSTQAFTERTQPPPSRQEYERIAKERAARDLADLLDTFGADPHRAAEDADCLDVYRARAALKLAVEALHHWQTSQA